MIQNQEIQIIMWKRFFTCEKRAKMFNEKLLSLEEAHESKSNLCDKEEIEKLENEINSLQYRMFFTLTAMRACASMLGCADPNYFTQN